MPLDQLTIINPILIALRPKVIMIGFRKKSSRSNNVYKKQWPYNMAKGVLLCWSSGNAENREYTGLIIEVNDGTITKAYRISCR